MKIRHKQWKMPNEKKVYYLIIPIRIYQPIFIGFKLTKQNDEKKEKGAAQIIIPTNLIFAGRIYLFFSIDLQLKNKISKDIKSSHVVLMRIH